MSSKSMPERSAPHHGSGRSWKCLSAFRRALRIQSGSDLRAEISSRTEADRLFFGVKIEWSGSLQPKRYPLVSSRRCSSWETAMNQVYTRAGGKSIREVGFGHAEGPAYPGRTLDPTIPLFPSA